MSIITPVSRPGNGPDLPSRPGGRDIVRELMRFIQSGHFAVGDRLPSIRELATTFGVSTSAVRDALMHVQSIGLVNVLPRSGAFVQSLDYAPLVNTLADTLDHALLLQADHNLFHLLETRQLIEVDCAAKAAEHRRLEDLLPVRTAFEQMDVAFEQINSPRSEEARQEFVAADIRFHLAIAKVAGNPVKESLLKALLGLIRLHMAEVPWTSDRKQITRQGHADLYSAILAGDAETASAHMEEHLRSAYEWLLNRVWSIPQLGETSTDESHADARREVS